MDVGGCEVVSQCEHGQQGCVACFVAIVVAELSACQLGAGGGFGGDVACLSAVEDGVAHEGEGDAAEIGASAEAGDDHVGVFAGQGHLFFGFEADDGLVQGDVAQDGAEGVFAVGGGAGQFDGFGDGGAQRALVVGVGGEDVFAGAGGHGGRGGDLCSVGLHDAAAVGLLFVADFHLIDGGFEAEQAGGVGQCGSPLSGSGFGGDVGHAFLFAVVGLCQG